MAICKLDVLIERLINGLRRQFVEACEETPNERVVEMIPSGQISGSCASTYLEASGQPF